MIEIEKCGQQCFSCENCFKDGRENKIYNVTVGRKNKPVILRLCEDCLCDLGSMIEEKSRADAKKETKE